MKVRRVEILKDHDEISANAHFRGHFALVEMHAGARPGSANRPLAAGNVVRPQ